MLKQLAHPLYTAVLLLAASQSSFAVDATPLPRTDTEWKTYFKDLRASKEPADIYKLASFYAAGHEQLGGKPDHAKAYELYLKAAETGYPEAQYRVGYCLEHKLGVKASSQAKAFAWYLKAADQEVAIAQLRVGEMYFYGDGVMFNDKLAYQYLIKAAERGQPEAQRLIGDCFKLGWGVSRNYVTALVWYNIASAQENDLSVRSRDTLISVYHLTKEDIEKADKLAKEYRPKK